MLRENRPTPELEEKEGALEIKIYSQNHNK